MPLDKKQWNIVSPSYGKTKKMKIEDNYNCLEKSFDSQITTTHVPLVANESIYSPNEIIKLQKEILQKSKDCDFWRKKCFQMENSHKKQFNNNNCNNDSFSNENNFQVF